MHDSGLTLEAGAGYVQGKWNTLPAGETADWRHLDSGARSRMLASMVEWLPCGICVVALDKPLTLFYANRCFYTMYGYTPEQMRDELDGCLEKTVWPADLPRLRAILAKAKKQEMGLFESEHRIVRRDGALQWSLVRGYCCSQPAEPGWMYCITVDITGRRAMEDALRVNEERFRIALAQTDSMLFDYEIKTKRMMHGDKSAERYGLSTYTENVPETLVESGVVHPDSAAVFYEMYRQVRNGAPTASCTIQARLVNGRYAWHRITMTTLYDGEGNAVRAVGFLEDIDDQKQREDDLLRRSERDTLTGLFNKGTTETRIEEYLRQFSGTICALLIIDIDEFKKVNDCHGHPFGDKTLSESARRISSLFHTNDIVGRIGGDEFIVFMKNLRSVRIVEKRALEVCEAFSHPFESSGDSALISCSVGASVSPRDGTHFAVLYQKADVALYDAKKNGKNRFRMYGPELHTAAWIPCSNSVIDTPAKGDEAQ